MKDSFIDFGSWLGEKFNEIAEKADAVLDAIFDDW